MAYNTLDMCDSFMAQHHHPQIYCPYEDKLEVHCGAEEVAVGSSVCHIINHTLLTSKGEGYWTVLEGNDMTRRENELPMFVMGQRWPAETWGPGRQEAWLLLCWFIVQGSCRSKHVPWESQNPPLQQNHLLSSNQKSTFASTGSWWRLTQS